MADQIATLEAELAEYRKQLDGVVSGLKEDPENSTYLDLKTSLEELVAFEEAHVAELRAEQPPPPPPVEQKWSRDKHPALQTGFRQAGANVEEPAGPVTYKVKDLVMAKWATGDKAFYPARIDSITGSSANPVYIVTFRDYGNSETLRSHDIKLMPQTSKKRMADGSPATPTTPMPSIKDPSVISAAASINAELASQVKREPSKASDGPIRPQKIPKKVKTKTEYEAGKSKWAQFQAKGAKSGKVTQKDSMFRTGDGVNARVGFTGSGQAMRKDPKRTRHIYDKEKDTEDI